MQQEDEYDKIKKKRHEDFEAERKVTEMISEFDRLYIDKEGELTKDEASLKFCDILVELIKVGKLKKSEDSSSNKLEFILPSAGTAEITIEDEDEKTDIFNLNVIVVPSRR